MKVNGKHVVFNMIKALKYPEEVVSNFSLIFSWDYLVYKKFIQDNGELIKQLGVLENSRIEKGGYHELTSTKVTNYKFVISI